MNCSIGKHVLIQKKCKFCSKKKTCKPCGNSECFFCHKMTFASEPNIIQEWSESNVVPPNMVWKTSIQKIKRKCKKCSREYSQRASDMLFHNCILCNNISEKKVFDFLNDEKYNFQYQTHFPWSSNFTFDFCIDNIIIELDGPQHFKPVRSWSSGWKTMQNDVTKETLALKNEYFIIRIAQQYIHDEQWKTFLKNTIFNIKKNKCSPCIFTQDCKEYNSGIYKRLHTEDFFF